MTYPLGLHYRLLSALRQQLHRQAMCLVLRLEYQRFSVPTDQLISYAFLKSTKTVTGFLNNVNVYCLSQNMMTAPRAQNVLLLVVSLISLCFQFVHADQARDRLNQFFNQVTTLEAEFQQVVFDENGSQIQRSSGHVKLFRPGRFRWEYITPSKQLILADGQSLWVYDVELEQASVKPMDESLGAAPIALLTELAPLENDFDINEAPIRANLEWVRLTPKLQDTGAAYIQYANINR